MLGEIEERLKKQIDDCHARMLFHVKMGLVVSELGIIWGLYIIMKYAIHKDYLILAINVPCLIMNVWLFRKHWNVLKIK